MQLRTFLGPRESWLCNFTRDQCLSCFDCYKTFGLFVVCYCYAHQIKLDCHCISCPDAITIHFATTFLLAYYFCVR